MSPQEIVDLSNPYNGEERVGIYMIICSGNNKAYIGKSINIKRRIDQHRTELKNNRHCNIHFQRSYNKYGKNSLSMFIIEFCEKNELDKKEMHWISNIDKLLSFNESKGGTGGHNYEITDRHRKLIGNRNLKRRSITSTGYKNVYFVSHRNTYEIRINYISYGIFYNPELAAIYRDVICRDLYKYETVYNFPFPDEESATNFKKGFWSIIDNKIVKYLNENITENYKSSLKEKILNIKSIEPRKKRRLLEFNIKLDTKEI